MKTASNVFHNGSYNLTVIKLQNLNFIFKIWASKIPLESKVLKVCILKSRQIYKVGIMPYLFFGFAYMFSNFSSALGN